MRTFVFAPSGARVWIFLIRRLIGRLNWIGVDSSGIKLLPQSWTNDLDQRGASGARTARTARASSGSFRHGTVKTRGLLLMTNRSASAAAKATPAMVALALTVGPHAFAQQPSTNPPVLPAQAAPGPNGQQQVQLISSPWTRYCAKGLTEQSSEIRTKEVCFTASDGHLTSGQKLVIALLIEPEGSDAKLLRVTLPLGVALVPGARIVIDEQEAMTAPFIVCLPKNGCMADYKADTDLIEKLKKGRSLAIQA